MVRGPARGYAAGAQLNADAVTAAIAWAKQGEKCDPPGTKELYTAWAAGRSDTDFSFMVGSACVNAGHIAGVLYELHALAEHALDKHRRFREAKDWGYTVAASYARSARFRYALAWGRQAARDGLCLALWPEERTEIALPSCTTRAKAFGIGVHKYERVRGHVRREAKALLAEFEGFLGDAIDANRKP